MKALMKMLGIVMIAALALTACSPNPGNGGDDGKAFRIPSDMKQFAGEYTIMLPGDEELGTEDSPAGTLTITEDDITATLDLAGSKAPLFGTYESLKEFYEFARKADSDSVYITGTAGSNHRFKISSITYEFSWYEFSGELNPQLIIRDNMSSLPPTTYNLEKN